MANLAVEAEGTGQPRRVPACGFEQGVQSLAGAASRLDGRGRCVGDDH